MALFLRTRHDVDRGVAVRQLAAAGAGHAPGPGRARRARRPGAAPDHRRGRSIVAVVLLVRGFRIERRRRPGRRRRRLPQRRAQHQRGYERPPAGVRQPGPGPRPRWPPGPPCPAVFSGLVAAGHADVRRHRPLRPRRAARPPWWARRPWAWAGWWGCACTPASIRRASAAWSWPCSWPARRWPRRRRWPERPGWSARDRPGGRFSGGRSRGPPGRRASGTGPWRSSVVTPTLDAHGSVASQVARVVGQMSTSWP